MPTWKGIGLGLAFCTATGVIAGLFLGGFPDLWKMGRTADWPWWAYALAVPIMGVAYIIGLALVDGILAPFTWRTADSPWQRIVFYLAAIVAGAVLLLGPLWLIQLSG